MRKTTWKELDLHHKDSEILPISEPPCKACKNFRPQRRYSDFGLEGIKCTGIKVCHAQEMFNDFSCFTEIVNDVMVPNK